MENCVADRNLTKDIFGKRQFAWAFYNRLPETGESCKMATVMG
jgi:hypothetical protein